VGNFSDPNNLHKYVYSIENPVNRVDPSGNFSFSDALVTVSISTILTGILTAAIPPAGHRISWGIRGGTAGFIASTSLVYAFTIGRTYDPKLPAKVITSGISTGALNVLGLLLGDFTDNFHLDKGLNEYALTFLEGFSWGTASEAFGSIAKNIPGLDHWFGDDDVSKIFIRNFTVGFAKSAIDSIGAGVTSLFTDVGPGVNGASLAYWERAAGGAMLDGLRSGVTGLYRESLSASAKEALVPLEKIIGDPVLLESLTKILSGLIATGLNSIFSQGKTALVPG